MAITAGINASIKKKSATTTIPAKIPKHFMLVTGEIVLAIKDTDVVTEVTNMAEPALLNVHEMRELNGVLPGSKVNDCFHASIITNKSSAPTPNTKNILMKFKNGNNDLQSITS